MIVYSGSHEEEVQQQPGDAAAESNAGQIPPTSATTTTNSWNISTSIVIDCGLRVDVSIQVSRGRPTTASPRPISRRRTESAPPTAGSCRLPASECETMCTSMSPDRRMTFVEVPAPPKNACRRLRRLDADDELRGVDAARELDEGRGHLLGDDLVDSCRRGSRPACAARDEGCRDRARPGRRGSSRAPRTAARRRIAAAMRAPRRSRVSPSGPPVSATTIRSRASHGASIPCSAR